MRGKRGIKFFLKKLKRIYRKVINVDTRQRRSNSPRPGALKKKTKARDRPNNKMYNLRKFS